MSEKGEVKGFLRVAVQAILSGKLSFSSFFSSPEPKSQGNY